MGQIMQLFSHPVITIDDYPGIEAIADEFHRKSLLLMEEFPEASLISDAWHSGRRAGGEHDFKNHGFTSYDSVNLSRREDFDFMNRAAMVVFAQYLRAVGRPEARMRLGSAWASVYGRGHYIPQHTHPMSHLSIVFYAAAREGTGQLVFENPARSHFQHFYPPEVCWMQYRFTIQPTKGMFVVFPSYLVHNTEPHQSDDPRIIYSANVQLECARRTDSDQ